MNAEKQKFSGTLACLREQLGLSQEKLARHLNVSFATVNRWENGHHAPSKLAKSRLHLLCKKWQAGFIGKPRLTKLSSAVKSVANS